MGGLQTIFASRWCYVDTRILLLPSFYPLLRTATAALQASCLKPVPHTLGSSPSARPYTHRPRMGQVLSNRAQDRWEDKRSTNQCRK